MGKKLQTATYFDPVVENLQIQAMVLDIYTEENITLYECSDSAAVLLEEDSKLSIFVIFQYTKLYSI